MSADALEKDKEPSLAEILHEAEAYIEGLPPQPDTATYDIFLTYFPGELRSDILDVLSYIRRKNIHLEGPFTKEMYQQVLRNFRQEDV